MSSHNKDSLEKRDTTSESRESHSDREVNKAEGNLEELMIEERLTKDDPGESKPLDSPNQVGTLTSKYDPLNEPIAGPSGLQEPRLESSDPESKVESLSDSQKEKSVEAKGLEENIEARMEEEDSDSTSTTSLFILSSTGETSVQEKSLVAESSRLRGEVDYPKHPTDSASIYMTESSFSSSSRRFVYASDSAHTSWDVSEIRSEIADISTGGGLHRDAPEGLEKDQSSRHASVVERQSSETSEANISELQDDDFVPPPRFKPDAGKKSKMTASKSCPALHSSSGSTKPKSLSSDESHRKECAEIKRPSVAQEVSKSESGRKSWQKSGLLPSMQHPTIKVKEDQTSPLREQDTELIETKDPNPETIETTTDKGSEGAAEITEQSESKPAIESSDLAFGSEADGTLKGHEHSFQGSNVERSVGKSKRKPNLSSSPPSDTEPSSSSPKAATSRPKKKTRTDKTRTTRDDC